VPVEIRMPALSPTMSEGNLARWLKKEGDEVRPGDVIAEIETDKATMEFEAIDEGRLGRILVPDGTEGVAVNQPIGILLEEGEDETALEGFEPGDGGGAPAKEEAKREETKPTEAEKPAAKPAAKRPEPRQPETQPAPRKGDGEDRGAERIFASPLARRMAAQAGIELATLEGSGPHGRIVKRDIERALSEGVPEAAEARPEPRPAVEAPRAPTAPPAAPAEAYEEIRLSNTRKVIARRMAESKQTVPHFYLSMDCELDALLGLRKELNAREGADYKLSVNDFIIKAAAIALRRMPRCNVAFGGDVIRQYKDVDISVAVAIPEGLITPIVRRADQKGLSTISGEMVDLAARAREGKLRPEEFQGGSFSISNLGMYGVKHFEAVINPPQACILAVGAAEQRPVVKDGALATATLMTCTLSVDHRAVDGAMGAEWLRLFKSLVEDPLAMLL